MCNQCPTPTPVESVVEKPQPKVSCPGYTRGVFSPETFPGIVDWAAERIARFSGPKIGAVAGCGHSGVLVAAAVGYKLRLPVIAVRKVDETTSGHDSEAVNAILQGTEHYAIIDDLVASGRTILRIVEGVARVFPQAKPAVLLLYNDNYTSYTVALPAGTPILYKP